VACKYGDNELSIIPDSIAELPPIVYSKEVRDLGWWKWCTFIACQVFIEKRIYCWKVVSFLQLFLLLYCPGDWTKFIEPALQSNVEVV